MADTASDAKATPKIAAKATGDATPEDGPRIAKAVTELAHRITALEEQEVASGMLYFLDLNEAWTQFHSFD